MVSLANSTKLSFYQRPANDISHNSWQATHTVLLIFHDHRMQVEQTIVGYGQYRT